MSFSSNSVFIDLQIREKMEIYCDVSLPINKFDYFSFKETSARSRIVDCCLNCNGLIN